MWQALWGADVPKAAQPLEWGGGITFPPNSGLSQGRGGAPEWKSGYP